MDSCLDLKHWQRCSTLHSGSRPDLKDPGVTEECVCDALCWQKCSLPKLAPGI